MHDLLHCPDVAHAPAVVVDSLERDGYFGPLVLHERQDRQIQQVGAAQRTLNDAFLLSSREC